MTSPSLLSRESTTLSPRWAQYGHFIAASRGPAGFGLIGELPHAGEVQAFLRREEQAEEERRADRQRVQHDGGADRRRRSARRRTSWRRSGTPRESRRPRPASARRRRSPAAPMMQKRAGERHVEAERHGHRPDAERDPQPERKRPAASATSSRPGRRMAPRPVANFSAIAREQAGQRRRHDLLEPRRASPRGAPGCPPGRTARRARRARRAPALRAGPLHRRERGRVDVASSRGRTRRRTTRAGRAP